MLAIKLAIRRLKDYRPPRWDRREHRATGRRDHQTTGPQTNIQHGTSNVELPANWPAVSGRRGAAASRLTATLAGLTVAILGYCLISALNARATYEPEALNFTYHDRYIHWLPHSFDSSRTWFAFWSYLGLACSFWAIRDWLLGKSAVRRTALRAGRMDRAGRSRQRSFRLVCAACSGYSRSTAGCWVWKELFNGSRDQESCCSWSDRASIRRPLLSSALTPTTRTPRNTSTFSGRFASGSGGCSTGRADLSATATIWCFCAAPSWPRARSFPPVAAARS